MGGHGQLALGHVMVMMVLVKVLSDHEGWKFKLHIYLDIFWFKIQVQYHSFRLISWLVLSPMRKIANLLIMIRDGIDG